MRCGGGGMIREEFPLYFGDKVPEEIKDTDEFLNTLKEKLKDYNNRIIGYSQECMGTFTVKDGKVTDIHLSGIVLIPKFRDKERGNNDNN